MLVVVRKVMCSLAVLYGIEGCGSGGASDYQPDPNGAPLCDLQREAFCMASGQCLHPQGLCMNGDTCSTEVGCVDGSTCDEGLQCQLASCAEVVVDGFV